MTETDRKRRIPRLGHRPSNSPALSGPVYRFRRGIPDSFAHALAAIDAWAAVTFAPARRGWQARYGLCLGLAAVLFLGTVVSLAATKSIFLGYDSINNYVHVWFIANSLYHSGSIPYRIPYLEGGHALTYPYGFLPWTLAALLYPALGDYAVTWTMVLGFLLLIVVVYSTRLRSDPWLFVLFLLCPVLVEALLSFQLSFVWASFFGYLYIHALERRAGWWAMLWWVMATSTHLIIIGPLLLIYSLSAWLYHRERRRLILQTMLFSLPVLVPLAWHTMQTPSVGYNSPAYLLGTTMATLARRGSLFFFPFILVKARQLLSGRRPLGRVIGIVGAVSLVAASVSSAVTLHDLSFLTGRTGDPYTDFLASSSFQKGAIYRVLEASDREQGHYFFVQHGAVLSDELFSESQSRHGWQLSVYRCFLTAKRIDYVVINREYIDSFHTNEQRLLEEMTSEGLVRRVYMDPQGRFDVFDVRQARLSVAVPVRRCFD